MVVWRCLCRVNPRDRKEFLAALQAAFGVNELDTDLQAQLLLSHRKIASSVIDSFPCNGERALLWRGAPRPRKKHAGHGQAADATEGLDPCGDFDPEASLGWGCHDPAWAPAVQGFGGRAAPCAQATPIGPVGSSASSSSSSAPWNSWTGLAELQYVEESSLSWTPWGDPSMNTTFLGVQDPEVLASMTGSMSEAHLMCPAPGLESIPDREEEEALAEAEAQVSDWNFLVSAAERR